MNLRDVACVNWIPLAVEYRSRKMWNLGDKFYYRIESICKKNLRNPILEFRPNFCLFSDTVFGIQWVKWTEFSVQIWLGASL